MYNNEENFNLYNELKDLVENYPNSYFSILKRKEYRYMLDYINSKTPLLQNYKYKINTKVYWVLNDITEFPKCPVCGKPLNEIYSVHVNSGYPNCKNCKLKQSPKTKAERFARKELNPEIKEKILSTYEIFYDDNKINEWAIDFKFRIGRRPTKLDFEDYFGRRFPRKSNNRNFDKSLFDLWDSWLELTVCDYLKSLGYEEKYVKEYCKNNNEFVRNSMFNYNGKWYQIDILFPTLNIGFEIQDFETHDKYSDNCTYRQRGNEAKHGPTYHAAKRNAAKMLNISIFEIWEDEIRNKLYKDKVKQCLNLNI